MADTAADLQQLSHRNESNSGRMFTALRNQQAELERYAEHVKALDAELVRLRSSIAELTGGQLESRVAKLAGELDATRSKLSAAEAGETAARRQLAEALAELNALREAHVKTDSEIAAAAAAAPHRFSSIDEATMACLRSEAEVRRLREQLAPMRASQALLARERDHLSAYKQETQGVRAQLAAKERELEASQLEARGLREAVARSLDHQLEIDRQLTDVLGSDFAREFRDAVGAPPVPPPDAPSESVAAPPPYPPPRLNSHAIVDAVVTAIVQELGGAAFRRAIAARISDDDAPPENGIATALASFFTLGGAGADDEDEGDATEDEAAARQEASAYLASVLRPHADRIAAAAAAPPPLSPARLQALAQQALGPHGGGEGAAHAKAAAASGVASVAAPAPAAPVPAVTSDRVPPQRSAGVGVGLAVGPERVASARAIPAEASAAPPAAPAAATSVRALQPTAAAASTRTVKPAAPAAQGIPGEPAAAAVPADADAVHRSQIGAIAASTRAQRAAEERGDPIKVIDNELRASPLLAELLDPRVFVRISATTFAPLEMLQHRVFILLAMGIEPDGEGDDDEEEDDLPDETMNGRLDLSMLKEEDIQNLDDAGVLQALIRAAGPRLRVNDSGAPRMSVSDGRAPPTPSSAGHTQVPEGVLTSSDWAAALRAAHPDAAERGRAVLELVKAIDADISDLVLSKDVYASGYRTLAAGATSSGGAPPVFAEGVQQALYRWIAAEACSLPYEEVLPGSAIALGRSVKKDEYEHGPLTLELIKEWCPALWGVLCGFPDFAVTMPREMPVTLVVWQSFFAKHYRQHTPLEHLHLLHSLKYMSDCTDSFLRTALARDASSGLDSYGNCSVM